jgi:hypothetical protein
MFFLFFRQNQPPNKMCEFIERLPQELEDKIREYVFCNTVKLRLLLDKHPLCFNFFSGLTKEQLNRLYKSALIHKFISWKNGYYSNIIKERVKYLFPRHYHDIYINHSSVYKFTEPLQPPYNFNKYWASGGKRFNPSILEYMQNIIRFCNHIVEFPRWYKNIRLQDYCDKIVHQMIICVLILKRKNEPKHKN